MDGKNLIVPGSRHKGLHLTLSEHFEKFMQVYVLINYRCLKSAEESQCKMHIVTKNAQLQTILSVKRTLDNGIII